VDYGIKDILSRVLRASSVIINRLVLPGYNGHALSMSTVAEIEAAIDQLPADEQQQLRDRLLMRAASGGASPLLERETWLNRLAALRSQMGTGKTAATSDVFWDDLRGERGV
jgi:hypothetical protein